MPSRSKKARVASLLPLLFFRCFGVDVRADGLAPRKARGGRLGQPPDEKAKEERLRESRRAHLPVSLWETACALPGAAPVLAIRGIAPGGWGQRPQSSVLAARWPHRDETNRFRKKPLRRRREGPFFPLTAPRSGLFAARDPFRRGRVFAPGAGTFVPLLFPPPGGDAEGGGGASFTPDGVSLGSLAQGRGKVGPLSGPIVARMGNNQRSRRPRLRLDKSLIFESECIVNYFI